MFQPERAGTTEYLLTTSPSLPLAQEGPESEEETTPPFKNLPSSTLFQDTQSLSQESLPDSEFALNCCCGATANANMVYLHEDGEVVQCDECGEWSHIACQRDARASTLGKDEPFLCDNCDLGEIKRQLPSRGQKNRASERK